MKFTFALIIIGLTLVLGNHEFNEEKLITRQSIEELKSKATFEVFDYENHPFKDFTHKQFLQKLGSNTSLKNIKREIVYGDSNGLPTSFHIQDKWPQCLHPIRDQEACGSCWAFAATEVLSDRFCIATNSTINVVLSPQDLVSCDWTNFGCNGGEVEESWEYLKKEGVVTDECLPYASGKDRFNRLCPFPFLEEGHKCKNGTFIKYKVSSHKPYYTIGDAKTTLFNEGPIEAAFGIYSDFPSYKGGVYRQTSEQLLGHHTVKVIGWGVDTDGTEYWIAANSWNVNWGENGFFRIAFGQSGFEQSLWAGIPLIEVSNSFLN